MDRTARSWWQQRLVAAGTLVALAMPGCRTLESVNPLAASRSPQAQMSPGELTRRLRGFCLGFKTTVDRTSRQILTSTEDREIRQRCLAWRTDAAETCWRILSTQSPLNALIELWALMLRAEAFFRDGEGRELFGESTLVAAQAYSALIESIREVADDLFPADTLPGVTTDVERFARDNPIRLTEVTSGRLRTDLAIAEDSRFGWIASPTRFLAFATGVDETARAIDKVAGVADEFTFLASQIPRDTSWQLELLLYRIEENAAVAEALADLHTFTDSVDRLSKTADTLPQTLQREIAQTFEELDSKQAELRATLTEARGVTEQVASALSTATTTAQALEQAADALADTGRAWEPTVREIRALAERDPEADAAPTTPTEPAGEPFDVTEYAAAAQALTETAVELRALLGDVRGTLASDEVPRALDQTTTRAVDLADHLFWRAVQLCVALFVLALAYRLITHRWAPRRRDT